MLQSTSGFGVLPFEYSSIKFLKKYIPSNPGTIKSIDGEICGQHDGLSYYTIGQRKGLGVGGG